MLISQLIDVQTHGQTPKPHCEDVLMWGPCEPDGNYFSDPDVEVATVSNDRRLHLYRTSIRDS
jgi:hypothetical protein